MICTGQNQVARWEISDVRLLCIGKGHSSAMKGS